MRDNDGRGIGPQPLRTLVPTSPFFRARGSQRRIVHGGCAGNDAAFAAVRPRRSQLATQQQGQRSGMIATGPYAWLRTESSADPIAGIPESGPRCLPSTTRSARAEASDSAWPG